MVQRKHKPGQEIRRVAQFDWRIIDHDCKKPFVASGLEFIPLPVSFLFLFFFYSSASPLLCLFYHLQILLHGVGDAWRRLCLFRFFIW